MTPRHAKQAAERRLPSTPQKSRAVLDARTAAHLSAAKRLLAALEPLTPGTYAIPPGYVRALQIANVELALALRRVSDQ